MPPLPNNNFYFPGITCRLDVIELLEKRVKSRFSHRQIFLFPGPESSDISNLKHALDHIEYYLKISNPAENISMKAKKQWNSELETLLKDKKFANVIQRLVDIDNSEVTLKNLLVNLVRSFLTVHLICGNFSSTLFLIWMKILN